MTFPSFVIILFLTAKGIMSPPLRFFELILEVKYISMFLPEGNIYKFTSPFLKYKPMMKIWKSLTKR